LYNDDALDVALPHGAFFRSSYQIEVVRGVSIYFVDDGEPRWRGAAGSCRWTWLDGFTQGGGATRHCGGVDRRNDEDYANIDPEDFSVVRWQ
jgi:hypothetical protein